MPSTFSARENKALTASCVSCMKPTPTALMVSLVGSENDSGPKQYSVCFVCANKGWRPPGFSSVYSSRYE
jgi:hypothetical protein